jgi:hypothetical protein
MNHFSWIRIPVNWRIFLLESENNIYLLRHWLKEKFLKAKEPFPNVPIFRKITNQAGKTMRYCYV